MRWQVKGAVQKVLGLVPGGGRVHYALQRTIGGLRALEDECDGKVDDWQIMAGHLASAGMSIQGTRFLEIGTGWYPALPFCLYLAGARQVHTFDLDRHIEHTPLRICAERLHRHLPLIAERGRRSLAEVQRVHEHLLASVRRGASLEEATCGCVRYAAPADARRTGLPGGAVDVVFSNSVLEHIPPPDIEDMMSEAHRVLRTDGVMFHSVNCGDHYAYVDGSITQLNYLRYSEAAWKKWNNAFLYQNRLRAVDFVRMAQARGFRIELETPGPSEQRREQLARIPVAPCFRPYTRDQLCVTSIDFIARRC